MAIQVVSAAIIQAGYILLAQRDYRSDYPLHWESSGGKVQQGESPIEALLRELDEELGSDVAFQIGREIGSVYYHNALIVTFYDVKIAFGRPRPITGLGLGWFTASEMNRLRLMPANEMLKDELAWIMAASCNRP